MYSKQDILSAIKQFYKDSGNKAIGQKSFSQATGISLYYVGKYWARWSDATKEAGVKHGAKWTREKDEVLVKDMIGLIRKYKKYPSLGEIRVSGSNYYTIIKKRGKPYMINAIVNYCNGKPKYKDILTICKNLQEDEIVQKYEHIQQGTVYLLKERQNVYKIGRTSSTEKRIPELNVASSEKLELVSEIKTDDPVGVEAYWHNRFKEKAMKRNEWFRLKQADVSAFKRWKKIF